MLCLQQKTECFSEEEISVSLQKGDKVYLAHFQDARTVDYVRMDGFVHLVRQLL